ncbi:MAG: aminopeptidase P family protein [Chloroflexi bacterium]|nr:MAG: aminopeptidase P family protein [Chloroflexota bacterium]
MDYNTRIEAFQTRLAEQADVAFFPISADLQYLMGIPRDIPNFGAVIHPGAWLEGAWLTSKHPPILPLPRMTAEFGGLERIKGVEIRVLGDWDDPAQMVRDILNGFNLPPKPRVAIGDKTSGETIIQLQQILPDAVFVSATDILRPLRVIKSEEEIAIMRRAGEITEAAFKDVIAKLKHGMTELELISEVDFQLRRHGSLGPSFVTSLYNSAPKHPLLFGDRMGTWKRVLNPPVSILFDFGAIYEGFCYDFGRTAFFGEPNNEMKRIHQVVMQAQAAGIAAMKAGEVTAEAVDAAARAVIEDAGYGAMFRHRLGHGIGMDVHEPPFLTQTDKTVLQAGMLFTVEPSIMQYHDFSARVEDVVVVRAHGGEPLTMGYQDLIVVE